MRVIGEIPHPDCKITIFNWNGKYLVKFERSQLEQTYKVSEMDVSSDEDVKHLAEKPFVDRVLARFNEMEKDLYEAMETFY